MSNKAIQAGVLGFISGFAGGKSDQRNLEIKEALRLRKEESAILKERRILKLRQDFAIQSRDEQLTADNLLDEQGNVIVEGLSPQLAAQANRANIRDLFEEQRKLTTTIAKESRAPVKLTPGSTIFSKEELTKELEEGGGRFTAPLKQSSSEIRTQFEIIKRNAKDRISNTAGSFSREDRLKLARASINETGDVGEKESLAYRAMTFAQAQNNVFSAADEQLMSNPSEFNQLSATVLEQDINKEQAKIDKGLKAIISALQKDLSASLEANPTMSSKDKAALIAQMSSNAKDALQQRGMWHETMGDIIANSLSDDTIGLFTELGIK